MDIPEIPNVSKFAATYLLQAAIEIKQMQSDIDCGEDIHDLLLVYGLTLDDAIDVLIFNT